MLKYMKNPIILFLLISLVVISFFGHLLLTEYILKMQIKLVSAPALIKSDTKCILYWLPMWNDVTFSFGSDKYEPFKHCAFKNCFATNNKDIIPIERFDAVVFHAAQYEAAYRMPSIRKPHQRYIFATMESPVSMKSKQLKWYREFYNWTMTYRLDSDIIMSYGQVIRSSTNYSMPDLESVNNKTRLVAWLVSHCRTNNKREIVYANLSKFIKINVFGECGTFKCPTDTDDIRSSAKCYDYFARKYKFYLSFENTHCKDYVTEKLYMLLKRNIVPIVYGAADYATLAPPHSVIIVDKFPSLKRLADYILFLDKNPKEYLKYFEWKKHYHIVTKSNRTPCTLCKMLNDPLQPPKIYTDVHTWWWGEDRGYCQPAPNFENANFSTPMFQNEIYDDQTSASCVSVKTTDVRDSEGKSHTPHGGVRLD